MRSEESMKAIEPLIARPKTAGLLVIGFKAWAVPGASEAELALSEQLAPGSSRAVWNLRKSPDARIAVTATEHASVRDALKALAQELEGNQLATLPRGPEEIGEISFREGETIRTELSYKYDKASLEDILGAAGLSIEKWMPADDGSFALALARAES